MLLFLGGFEKVVYVFNVNLIIGFVVVFNIDLVLLRKVLVLF